MYFSDTRFLHEAKEVQRNASRLKHLLVLACRLLAMSLIIFAFAQPFLAAKDDQVNEANHISFFIDNSFSMEAGGQQLGLLEEAKSIAEQSIKQYPDHYSFHVFDHKFAGEDQQWIDKEKALNKVKRTVLTGAVKTVSQIVGRQRQMRERLDEQPMSSYIFTDGQKNIFDALPDFEDGEQIQIIRLNPIQVANISIDSAWVNEAVILPGQSVTLFVQLSNYGTSAVNDIRLSFTSDGQSRPAGSFDIPPGQSMVDTIPVTFSSPGWKSLRLKIEDESIRFDDELLLTLAVSDQIRVLLVNENNHEQFFRAAILGNKRTQFERRKTSNLIYSDFQKYDLIIVDGLNVVSSGLSTELDNYIRSGGNVLFFPEANGDVKSYNNFLRTLKVNQFGALKQENISVLGINTKSSIFKNVYRRTGRNLKTPTIQKYFTLSKNAVAGKEELLSLRNRDPYLVGYQLDRGNLYLCTAATDESSSDILGSGSFFVPMVHRMSISARSGIAPFYTVGSNEAIVVTPFEEAVDPVYKLEGNIEVIPARYQQLKNINLYAGDQIDQSGFYKLTTQDSLIANIAFNYERSESKLSMLSNEALLKLNPDHISVINTGDQIDVAEALVNKSRNTVYWKWCIILALIFLLIEQLLLRWRK